MHDLTDSLRAWRRVLAATVLAWVVAVIGIAVAVLAVPDVVGSASTVSVPYRQQFSLLYSGHPTTGGLYGSNPATTGEPLYLGSLENLTMELRYRFSSQGVTALSGTLTAAMVVEDQGLNQFVVAPEKVAVNNGTAGVNLAVPLSQFSQQISHLSAATDASSFPVDVVAAVAVTGSVSGRRVNISAQASYVFTGTSTMLLPTPSNSSSGLGSTSTSSLPALTPSGATSTGPAMLSSSSGATTRTVPASGSVKIDGFRIPGLVVVLVGAGVAAAAGSAGMLFGRKLRRSWRRDPRLAVLARLGGRAVAMHGAAPGGGNVVYVEGAEDLRRLSRLLEVPVLRADEVEGGTIFMVHDDRYVYCYRVGAPDIEEVSQKPVPEKAAAWMRWSPTERGARGAVVANGSSMGGRQPGHFKA